MKYKQLMMCAFFLSGMSLAILKAQEAMPASGGEASGGGGSVSYSIGQVMYTTNTGTSGSATQGVQQAYIISEISGIEQSKGITLEYSVYPNPTIDFLNLRIRNYNNMNLTYQILDVDGKLLKNEKTEGEVTTISMKDLIPGVYFLRVSGNKKEVKTFQIIKK